MVIQSQSQARRVQTKIAAATKLPKYEQRLAAIEKLVNVRDLYLLYQRDPSIADVLTPFQRWFWTVADFTTAGFPRVLVIPLGDDDVVQVQKLPKELDEHRTYIVPTIFPDQYYAILSGKYKLPMVLYQNRLYHSFKDTNAMRIPEPKDVQRKTKIPARLKALVGPDGNVPSSLKNLLDPDFTVASVVDLPAAMLHGLFATEDDYFVYTPSKRAFRNYKIREYPTVLGNFIAAEKLHYHTILTSHGLMHPSTTVYYGQELFHLLTRHPQRIVLQQTFQKDIMIRMGFSGATSSSKKIMKLPFSSSSYSIELAKDREKLFADPFFEYGCIVQQYNLVHRDDRIREIRCMVVDGQVVCGCTISIFRGLQYQIRLFETDREGRFRRSPCVDLFLETFGKRTETIAAVIREAETYLPKVPPFRKPAELLRIDKLKKELHDRALFVEYVTDFVNLVQRQFAALSQIVKKTFRVFNDISITRPLPTTLQSFQLQQHSQQQLRIFRSVRKPDSVQTSLSNKVCIERFLADPQNYLNLRFHERFLRIDCMYWPSDDRFYVNEVETYACGKFANYTDGFFNHSIFSLIHARML